MSDDRLFADPGELFATVDAMRGCFARVESDPGLQPVSLSNSDAADDINTVVALAADLPNAFAPQLELLARSISLGALDVMAADHVPSSDD